MTARAVCGTVGGYKRHRRVPEDACAACKAAWARNQRKSRSRSQPERVMVPLPLLVDLLGTASPEAAAELTELLPYLGSEVNIRSVVCSEGS